MRLAAGSRLGPYEIASPISAGGMGEVYKARDTRLDRLVAVKVCKEPFSERFEREARAVAALNHPHICQLHDVGPDYLVMEHIEGEPPAGPLPVARAVELAAQVAGALAEAHRKGITHRDLKPSNVLVTRSGIKLVDFGLASVPSPLSGSTTTFTESLTQEGHIVGTLFYMSPEQVSGLPVGPATDVYALGLVLYEMITGRRAVEGETPANVIAAILERPVPSVAGVAPASLDRVIKRCVEKDPERRWQSAGDLQWALTHLAIPDGPASAVSRPWFAQPAPAWLMAGMLVAGFMFSWLARGPVPTPVPAATLTIVPPAGLTLVPVGGQESAPELSPDGSSVLFRGEGGYYVRRLDSLEATLVPGSASVSNVGFWSADSTSVVFPRSRPERFEGAQLVKVRLPDGAPEIIAEGLPPTRTGSWSDRGTILIAAGGLWTVPATGGRLERVDLAGLGAGMPSNPDFLPGGDAFLFQFRPAGRPADDAGVYLATLQDRKALAPTLLLKNPTAARFTPAGGGRLLFVRGDNLYAQRLSVETRQLEGEPELLVTGIASQTRQDIARGEFSVARTGTVAWRAGRLALSQVTVFDRQGRPVATAGPPDTITNLVLSPDESRILASGDGAWLLDVGQSARRALPPGFLPFGWSQRGTALLGVDGLQLVELSADDPSHVRTVGALQDIGDGLVPQDVSQDGVHLLIQGRGGRGLFAQSLDGPDPVRRPDVVVPGDAPVFSPRFSPDGRWIVYEAVVRDGQADGTFGGLTGALFVQPFPGPGRRQQIAAGGTVPEWRRDGKEIVYLEPHRLGTVMAVSVERAGDQLRFGTPRALFSGLRRAPSVNRRDRPLAVATDGSRIYWPQRMEQPGSDVIHVKTGWVQ